MDPVGLAAKATPIVVQHGVLGAVVLCACVVIFFLAAAVVTLWRAKESETRKRIEAQDAHYRWAIDEIGRKTEVERRLVESLSQLRETMTVVLSMTGRINRDAQ